VTWSPSYGPHSPFGDRERDTVDTIVEALQRHRHSASDEALATIREHFSRLEAFGELLDRYPSPFARQRLGEREHDFESLVARLCRSSPADFEFRAPTRAIVGRALDMAQVNFYRLLRHVCTETIPEPEASRLRTVAVRRMREVIYTKLVEELLGDLVTDAFVDGNLRRRASHELMRIWERRLTYRAVDFFPLLEATWEARNRVEVLGGTLMGAQEIFSLLREGCDPDFVEYLTNHDPSEDEVAAFREFLFGATSEQLASLDSTPDQRARHPSTHSFSYGMLAGDEDPAAMLYEFFSRRYLQSMARRLADLPGPKRTAEGYVLLAYLAQAPEMEKGK
jgi:hypothetical protein